MGKDLEGSDRGLVDVPFRHLSRDPGEIMENLGHNSLVSRMGLEPSTVGAQIRTGRGRSARWMCIYGARGVSSGCCGK
jgi:hypothetical protein